MAAANDLEMVVSMHVGLVVDGAADRARRAVHGQPRLGRDPHVRRHARVAVQRDVPAVPEPEDRAVRGRDRLDPVLPRARRAGARQAALLGAAGRAVRRTRHHRGRPRHARRPATCSAITSSAASSTTSTASPASTRSARTTSCARPTTRTPTPRGPTASRSRSGSSAPAAESAVQGAARQRRAALPLHPGRAAGRGIADGATRSTTHGCSTASAFASCSTSASYAGPTAVATTPTTLPGLGRAAREQAPVHEGIVHELTGFAGAAMFQGLPFPDRPHFSAFCSRRATPRSATTNCSRRRPRPTVRTATASRSMNSMLSMGGAEHRRYRALVQPSFVPAKAQWWINNWIEQTVHALIDNFVDDGRAELNVDFSAADPGAHHHRQLRRPGRAGTRRPWRRRRREPDGDVRAARADRRRPA